MDTVFVTGLKTEGVIGVFEWEREIRQLLFIDLEMATDIATAATTDDLTYTLDYKSICDFVIDYVASTQFKLIETLAEKLAAMLMIEFSVPWIRLAVHKPGAIAPAQDLGVRIERGVKP